MSKFILICLVAYISILVGFSIASIGKVPDCANIQYTPWLPIEMFILVIIPTILGYWVGWIGKDES